MCVCVCAHVCVCVYIYISTFQRRVVLEVDLLVMMIGENILKFFGIVFLQIAAIGSYALTLKVGSTLKTYRVLTIDIEP